MNAQIDHLLGIDPNGPVADGELPGEVLSTLQVAARMKNLDLQGEIRPNPELRERWASYNTRHGLQASNPNRLFHYRWAWAAVIGLVLISAFLVFRQPVLAAVGRILGYGYFPQAGFVLLDTAQVLRVPVQQDHAGQSLTVLAGLATPEKTTLWLKFSTGPQPLDGAWLETSAGEKIKLISWQWDQNSSSHLALRLEFLPLPERLAQTVLALPEGWRLPLEWIPATQAYALPLGTSVSPPSTIQAGTPVPTQQLSIPCQQDHELQVCLKAVANDPQGTHLLLEATSLEQDLTPGSEKGLIARTSPLGDLALSLKDQVGNRMSALGQFAEPVLDHSTVSRQSLTFPLVSPNAKTLTLQIPGIYAQQRFASPILLQIDVGADPRPGQSLSLDQGITVLGQTIRFRQAVLEGDGVTSLRLILTSDSIPGSKLQFLRFDLGKPEGIDDQYGSGFVGQKRISINVELMGVLSGKKTGIITLPITGVHFIRFGPFEFTFPAPAPVSWIPTPTPMMTGENFIPQPIPTPFALDGYRYFNRPVEPGDVLWTVVGETTTDLYKAHPGRKDPPERVAVLPGQVFQVNVHPDRQGIDYLAGAKTTFYQRSFYWDAQVYTLRFSSGGPKLLARLPHRSDMIKMTDVRAAWSADGQFLILQQSVPQMKPGDPYYQIYWMDLNCHGSGACPLETLAPPTDLRLWLPHFSPHGTQLLFSGVRMSNYGPSGVYWMEIGADRRPGPISQIVPAYELSPQWLPDGKSYLAACAGDTLPINEYDLCRRDVMSGETETLLRLPHNMFQFDLSPDGKYLVDTNYEPVSKQDQLRLFDIDTRQVAILTQANNLNWDERHFSPDSRYLGLAFGQGTSLILFDMQTGQEVVVFDTGISGSISWTGWAR